MQTIKNLKLVWIGSNHLKKITLLWLQGCLGVVWEKAVKGWRKEPEILSGEYVKGSDKFPPTLWHNRGETEGMGIDSQQE